MTIMSKIATSLVSMVGFSAVKGAKKNSPEVHKFFPGKKVHSPGISNVTAPSLDKRKVMVISGAGGMTARTPIMKFMQEGYIVMGLTSNKEMLKLNQPGIHYILVDRNKISSPEYIQKVVEKGFADLGMTTISEVVALNLIGGAVAPKGSTLKKLNRDLPIAFFEGVKQVAEDRADKVSLIHISSLAATINGDNPQCEYAQIKKEVDETILQMRVKQGNILILRPGIILPDATPEGRVDMGHDYSPEQFANMPIVPILGSGNQIQQPVHEQCLYEAAVNGAKSDESLVKIVDAVGADVLTQKEMFIQFCSKGNLVFVHIPYEVAEPIADHFPLGRIAPYSIQLFKTLDSNPEKNRPIDRQEFEKILGRKPKGFYEVYNQPVVGGKAPIVKHVSIIGANTLRDPRKGFALFRGFIKSLNKWSFSKK